MKEISQKMDLSDAKKKSLQDIQLQKLFIATGNAKLNRAVEQVKASLEEGLTISP